MASDGEGPGATITGDLIKRLIGSSRAGLGDLIRGCHDQ
jgi:hypothetical protein